MENDQVRDYRFEISTDRRDIQWDQFVCDTQGGHHVQTSLWGQVKATLGWSAFRILYKDRGDILAGAQILINRYPVLGKAGYITKGPLFKIPDPDLARELIRQLIKICKNKNKSGLLRYSLRITVITLMSCCFPPDSEPAGWN